MHLAPFYLFFKVIFLKISIYMLTLVNDELIINNLIVHREFQVSFPTS